MIIVLLLWRVFDTSANLGVKTFCLRKRYKCVLLFGKIFYL